MCGLGGVNRGGKSIVTMMQKDKRMKDSSIRLAVGMRGR